MSIARGGTTPSQKTITMNVSCPTGSIGNKLYYWFNPVTGTSRRDGIIDNMLTGSEAASNVGIIFKKDNTPLHFMMQKRTVFPRPKHHKALILPLTIIE